MNRNAIIAEVVKLLKIWLAPIIFFYGLLIPVAGIHELGHAAAALLIGVPSGEIRFLISGIVPMTRMPESFAASNLTLFHYAGGLNAGLILVFVYFLFWSREYKKNPTPMKWSLGLAIAALAGVEFFEGYFEGHFNVIYRQNLSSGSGITVPIIYLVVAICTGFVHGALLPYPKTKIIGIDTDKAVPFG